MELLSLSRRKAIIVSFIFLLILIPTAAAAQTYSFSVDVMDVDVYWNEDGTADVEYSIQFTNSQFADPIDFVDVGLPNPNYDISAATAEINGTPITNIEESPYVDNGIALGLGAYAIPPGETGRMHVLVRGLRNVLFVDDQDDNYASAVFRTTYFDSEFVQGQTNTSVTFHLPPGVQPEEPRWHSSPSGFPDEPITGFDDEGRITYTWVNPNASASDSYRFGASFPQVYVPETAVASPTISDRFQIPVDELIGGFICFSIAIFFFGVIGLTIYGSRRRQLQYMPPKISIEGHGIKRGLTAIEAAILMEQPMDKIMTMMLFSVIKKNAAEVTSRDPLELKTTDPLPESLRPYEVSFVRAFAVKGKARRKALQDTMVDLVQSVSKKMKGFSRKETIKYYQDITRKAWAQVEAADTPEVKSQKYDEVMEWTMLDREFDTRTREVFRHRPIFVPTWWGRYDPTFGRASAAPGGGGLAAPAGGRASLPTLPGGEFAASMVTGIENFSSNVVGNLTDFTGGITSKTNPAPKTSGSSYRGGSGGSSCACACACACAGCACACAGGGR